MIGRIVGNRYKIRRKLGSGTIAWSYLAEDTTTGGPAVVKVLYPQYAEDVAYAQRFIREAKVAMSLRPNPHIARVLGYGADQDMRYLVVEYIEGRDVKRILAEDGPFSQEQVLNVAAQVAKALAHVVEHGVVYCDIKPQNLIIGSAGQVKLTDLGMARSDALPSLTQTGIVGSLYYISPEQAMGMHTDIRSSIYALGIIMYEMLAGAPPFSANTPWAIVNMHISGQFIPLLQRQPNVSEDMNWLISKATARAPQDRFQTPAELGEAVDWVAHELRASAQRQSPGRDAASARPGGPGDRREGTAQTPAPAAADTSEARRRRERAMALYGQGLMHFGAREWSAAKTLLMEVSALVPGYQDTETLLALIEERLAKEQANPPSPD